MFDPSLDARVRAATFDWLAREVAARGDVLPRTLLLDGFLLGDERVRLMSPQQGIFKPRPLKEVPLSITTSPESPYNDAFGEDGLLRYRYRGTDPGHPDNRGLRSAMQRGLPLVYFHGLVPGRYVATWPVYIVRDEPARLTFSVAVDDASHARLGFLSDGEAREVHDDREGIRRAYVTAAVRVRLHQRAFRERVLEAYRRECSFCRFRHEELLDAAHIVEDARPEGVPEVRNGLALCTLHHRAFDKKFIGVRPDYVIEVRPDILSEQDGPTLKGLQILHGARIQVPRSSSLRPDPDLLHVRYEQFVSSF